MLQSGGILCPGRGCGSGIFPGDGVRRILCEKQTGGCGVRKLIFETNLKT